MKGCSNRQFSKYRLVEKRLRIISPEWQELGQQSILAPTKSWTREQLLREKYHNLFPLHLKVNFHFHRLIYRQLTLIMTWSKTTITAPHAPPSVTWVTCWTGSGWWLAASKKTRLVYFTKDGELTGNDRLIPVEKLRNYSYCSVGISLCLSFAICH